MNEPKKLNVLDESTKIREELIARFGAADLANLFKPDGDQEQPSESESLGPSRPQRTRRTRSTEQRKSSRPHKAISYKEDEQDSREAEYERMDNEGIEDDGEDEERRSTESESDDDRDEMAESDEDTIVKVGERNSRAVSKPNAPKSGRKATPPCPERTQRLQRLDNLYPNGYTVGGDPRHPRHNKRNRYWKAPTRANNYAVYENELLEKAEAEANGTGQAQEAADINRPFPEIDEFGHLNGANNMEEDDAIDAQVVPVEQEATEPLGKTDNERASELEKLIPGYSREGDPNHPDRKLFRTSSHKVGEKGVIYENRLISTVENFHGPVDKRVDAIKEDDTYSPDLTEEEKKKQRGEMKQRAEELSGLLPGYRKTLDPSHPLRVGKRRSTWTKMVRCASDRNYERRLIATLNTFRRPKAGEAEKEREDGGMEEVEEVKEEQTMNDEVRDDVDDDGAGPSGPANFEAGAQ